MTHKFLLQVEDGDDTRWQMSDEEAARVLAGGAEHLIMSMTSGRRPQVTIRPVETPSPIDERVFQHGQSCSCPECARR
jgi:hypothetical protein